MEDDDFDLPPANFRSGEEDFNEHHRPPTRAVEFGIEPSVRLLRKPNLSTYD